MSLLDDLKESANSDAYVLAQAGNDEGAAALMSDGRYTEKQEFLLTERGILKELGLSAGGTVLSGLEQATGLERIVKLLQPNQGGLDVANTDATGLFATLVAASICTQSQADTLLSLGDQPKQFTAAEISKAMEPERPEGKIQQ